MMTEGQMQQCLKLRRKVERDWLKMRCYWGPPSIPFPSINEFTQARSAKERMLVIVFYAICLPLAIIWIPVALAFHLLFGLLQAAEYCVGLWRINRKPLLTPNVRQPNSFGELWWSAGLTHHRTPSELKAELAKGWIATLYGEGLLDCLGIDEEVEKIRSSNFAANIPYYNGDENACHFHFVDPIDTVIERLCGELPFFNQKEVIVSDSA
jgi:hypothetical protein